MATKTRPKIGDEAWEVEWCKLCPEDEDGSIDWDKAKYVTKHFPTQVQAKEYAKEVLPRDFFGYVSITPIRFVPYDEDEADPYPYAGFWEAIGDEEIYEGERP